MPDRINLPDLLEINYFHTLHLIPQNIYMHSSTVPTYDFLQQEKPVYSGPDALMKFTRWMKLQKQVNQCVILCDTHTNAYCTEQLISTCFLDIPVRKIVIDPGEASKSLKVCNEIWQQLTSMNVQRDDLLINVGGGVVTDIGGFVASVYVRGLRFVNIPTSLMAMADAALGGKTGIDLDHIKNRIGTFSFPDCTVCFPDFLDSLNDVEWKSGSAEVYKHALIADADVWKLLAGQGCTRENFVTMLHRIQRVKLEVVHVDPYEKGVRKILNFGHTLGHALESRSLHTETTPLTHGQAVAMGMILETEIARQLDKITNAEADEILEILEQRFGKLNLSDYTVSSVLQWIRYDKKNVSHSIRMSLLTSIGSCDWNVAVDENLVKAVLLNYQARNE